MHSLTLLAKLAAETYIKEKKVILPPKNLSEEFLKNKSGTFVTIEENDKLRGCIGTYLPTKENIAREVIFNSIAAATEDYRFGSIQEDELPHLSYTVYILSQPQLVKDISELNPKEYGIIIKTIPIASATREEVIFNGHLPHKSGLLLPDLKGIDTVEKQILVACQKGGINPSKEKILIYRFSVKKYI